MMSKAILAARQADAETIAVLRAEVESLRCYIVDTPLAQTVTIPREVLERVREALEQTISLLRATDELQANGFADDAVNQARAAIAALEGVL